MVGIALIYIAIATSLALIFNGFFNFLRGRAMMALLAKHLDQGHALDAELIQLIQKKRPTGQRDIRRAIMLSLLGVTAAIYSTVIENVDFAVLMQGAGIFMMVSGLGFWLSMLAEKRFGGEGSLGGHDDFSDPQV